MAKCSWSHNALHIFNHMFKKSTSALSSSLPSRNFGPHTVPTPCDNLDYPLWHPYRADVISVRRRLFPSGKTLGIIIANDQCSFVLSMHWLLFQQGEESIHQSIHPNGKSTQPPQEPSPDVLAWPRIRPQGLNLQADRGEIPSPPPHPPHLPLVVTVLNAPNPHH